MAIVLDDNGERRELLLEQAIETRHFVAADEEAETDQCFPSRLLAGTMERRFWLSTRPLESTSTTGHQTLKAKSSIWRRNGGWTVRRAKKTYADSSVLN